MKEIFIKQVGAQEIFWKFFWDISQIPRRSGSENKTINYLIKFAKQNNFRYYSDNFNNIIIYKDNQAPKTIGLQAHIDMICEKEPFSKHNFDTDPLQLMVENGFVSARHTSLGADNGIGVAYILAILESDIKNVNFECIFTSSEEIDMSGAKNIDASKLITRQIISFDNFREDELVIGSTSAAGWTAIFNSPKIANKNDILHKITLKGFLGGHSGIDISDASRGNPIKIMCHLLTTFSNIKLASINSNKDGQMNAIPTSCEAIFSIDNIVAEKIKKELTSLKKKFPNASITQKTVKSLEPVFSKIDTQKIFALVDNFDQNIRLDPHGILFSANFGRLETIKNQVLGAFSMRTNSQQLQKTHIKKIESNIKKNDFIINDFLFIPIGRQNNGSELVLKTALEYELFFQKTPQIIKTNGCLEWSFFTTKIPNLEFVTFAPNILNAHSTHERLDITSANRVFNFLKKLLLSL
jgi:dipeptidase D